MNDSDKELTRPFLLRWPIRDRILFAKRLAMVLRSGVPLRDGLVMLSSPKDAPSGRYIISHIIDDVSRGITLSDALAHFGRLIGPFAVSMVRVGERSGTLGPNLLHLSDELKKRDALRKKVIGALVYPAVIVVATVAISLVLTVYIFPKIMPIFKGFKHSLPLSTRILIALSDVLIHQGIWILVGLIALALTLALLMRVREVRARIDRIVLVMPLIGSVTRLYYQTTITRTLGTLLSGDVRIVPALELIAESLGNCLYREDLRAVARGVARGKQLSSELQQRGGRFPALTCQLIKVGEETGDLTASLLYLSDMCEEDINDLTKNLTTLLEPVLMVIMGLIVGFIAISIIAPIYGITQDLTLK